MIVVVEDQSLLLITQGDHAHLAAELLSLCRFPDLVSHPRRQRLLEATREHDNGWRESDAAPSLDSAAGAPHSYATLPDTERRRLWSRACTRYRDTDPYIALLITEHALTLHRTFEDRVEWIDWLGETEALRDELINEADYDVEALAEDYSLLRFADLCSLTACSGSREMFEQHGTRGSFRDGTLLLDPLPLAGATSFQVACRRIPRRAYGTATELGVELASSLWQRQSVRVAQADPDRGRPF